MKLLFNKKDNNDITIKIQQGTVPVEFTYTEMIKQLLENNTIDDTDFGNLSDDEQENLEDMLNKISEIFNEEETDQIAQDCRNADLGCVDCKQRLAEVLVDRTSEIRAKRKELLADPTRIDEILAEGAQEARQTARETLKQAKKVMNLTGE
jgi:hypothetical protein